MAKDAEELAAQAERLRQLRKQSRVTFRQIAEAVDVTERQAQRWLSPDKPSGIDPQNLKKLAAYLGTTPDYIEYGTIRRKTPDLRRNGSETQLTRLEQKLDRVLYALDAATEEEAQRVREALEPLVAVAVAESTTQKVPRRSGSQSANGQQRHA